MKKKNIIYRILNPGSVLIQFVNNCPDQLFYYDNLSTKTISDNDDLVLSSQYFTSIEVSDPNFFNEFMSV